MHGQINGMGLQNGLSHTLNNFIDQAEKQAGKGPSHYPQACEKLDDFQEHVVNHVGKEGLSYTEAGALLHSANQVGALLGCMTAVPPTPAALEHLLALMGTIDGMGLSNGEANDLLGKTSEVAKKLIDHQGYQTCKKLGDLQKQIEKDTGKPNKLTAAQGATLTAAVTAIGTELGC
jgi:hypothetical protein